MSKLYAMLIIVFILMHGNTYAREAKGKLISDPSGKGHVNYMKKLAKKKGSRYTIDLSDSKQNSFVMARLAEAGKTSKNSPQLFKFLMVVKQRQTELRRLGLPTSYTTRSITRAETVSDPNGVINSSHHSVSKVVPVVVDNGERTNLVKAQVLSTIANGTDMTYVDVVMYDDKGNQLCEPEFVESYAEGTDVRVTVSADYESILAQNPEAEVVVLDSMVINSIDGQEEPPQFLLHRAPLPDIDQSQTGTLSKLDPLQTTAVADVNQRSVLDNYTRIEPTDKNGDNIIMLCLNRSHADCDYPQFSSGSNEATYVRIPFKGEFTFNKEVLKIYAYNDPELDPATFSDETGIYVYAKNQGGTTVLQNFSSYLRLDVDPITKVSTISWDIPRAEGVFQNSTLYARYEEVNWFFKINVQFQMRSGSPSDVQFSASTGEYSDDWVLEPNLPKLKFAYSCIAAGTEIRMGDGSLMPIETIKEGMTVQAHGAVLPVTDVSIGIETIPMYRITDHKGNSVLLTESHPVITANRGIIWASEVKRGDRLKTEWGTTLVKSVSTELFNDKIYNLKLGKGIEPSPGAHPLNAMFANGILVGDLSMQAAYEYKNAIDKKDVLSRLPEKWHQDFLNSLDR